jgi:Protein of unknown function (DUF2934)
LKRELHDVQAGAPRKLVSEQREAPFQSNLRAEIAQDELYGLIAEEARARALERGLALGYEEKDWLEAEARVMTRLGLWE